MQPASRGMTFIEIAIALLIIGLMAAVMVPTLFKRSSDRRQPFIADLNLILQSAVNNAIATNSFHRIKLDFNSLNVTLEKAHQKGALKDLLAERYVPVLPGEGILKASSTIPATIIFRHFFIEGKDELAGGLVTKYVWFAIDNNGSIQDIIIVIGEEEREDFKSLIVNPFSKRFEVYDGIQRPS